jgi:hypothetical protein
MSGQNELSYECPDRLGSQTPDTKNQIMEDDAIEYLRPLPDDVLYITNLFNMHTKKYHDHENME